MVFIGTDGKMTALRQVLTPQNFAKIEPGMRMEDVGIMLGKPAKISRFAPSKDTHYDWRWIEGAPGKICLPWCSALTWGCCRTAQQMKSSCQVILYFSVNF